MIEKILNILTSFRCVFLGIFITAITAFFLTIAFIIIGSIVWADVDDSSGAFEITITISLILAVVISAFLGGYMTARFSESKDYIHIAATAIVLLIIFFTLLEFDFSYFTFEEYFYTAAIPIFVFIGGWFRIKRKKSKASNIPSSQTDTAEQ